MLKKLLVVTLACILVLSSMAVVSFADTTEPQEWVEDFNSYTSDNFKKANSNLYFNNNNPCQTPHHAALGYHYELNDDWVMWNISKYLNTDYFAGSPKLATGYNGKAKDDVSVYTSNRIWPGYRVSNFLDGVPVDLSTGKVFKFSMDWFNEATQSHVNHVNTTPNIIVNATLSKSGSDDVTADLTIASILANVVKDAFNSNVATCNAEAWNALDLYISKDTINLKANEDATLNTFYSKNYNPSNSTWTKNSDSGYEIKSINSLTILFNDQGKSKAMEEGYDNLKISVLDSMPQTIVGRHLPFYANFQAITSAKLTSATSSESNNGVFQLHSGGAGSMIYYDLSQNYFNTSSDKPFRINAEVMFGDNVLKAQGVLNESSGKTEYPYINEDGYYKVHNIEQDAYVGEGYFEPLSRFRIDPKATTRLSSGDKVQISYDFKFDGNEAKTDRSFIEIDGTTPYNTGRIINLKSDGRIFDGSGNLVAKLKPGTMYSIDTIYTVNEAGTEVKMYIDGSKILTTMLENELTSANSNFAYRITYVLSGNTNEDGTKYLANAIYLDNVCYQVFKGGANAFNFDKSASLAPNKAIANADVDFVNNTIFPVDADFTVADFNALNLTNAIVLNADGSAPAEADSLVGKKIVFSGEYGKDVSFTVSGEGGQKVTENSFVTLRENLGNTFAASANAGKLLTAKAVKDGADLEVYVAEYKDGELVGLTVGEGVANYTPKAQGNKIKVLIWNDGELVPAFTGAAYELNVQ